MPSVTTRGGRSAWVCERALRAAGKPCAGTRIHTGDDACPTSCSSGKYRYYSGTKNRKEVEHAMAAKKSAKPAAKKTAKRSGKREMSAEHKDALASGRRQGRAVRNYLEALEAHKPKRGRKRTTDSVASRLDVIAKQLPSADPMNRLLLLQEQRDLSAELESMDTAFDISELEAEFIEVAAEYSEMKGISYAVWREMGITPAVLRAAGIGR
jgi:hypothetical protein